jgi:hypothetical protein
VVACYNAVRPYQKPAEVTATDDGPPAWYERRWVAITAAPVLVPVVIGFAGVFTVASPVERFPAVLFLVMLVLYLVLLLLFAKILTRRPRAGVDGDTPAVTLGGDIL